MLHFLGLSEHRLRHFATRMGACLVLALVGFWPLQGLAQHTSVLCPAQTGTVTSGETVTIDISACEFPGNGGIGLINGGSQGFPDFENHGTDTTRQGASWFVDYGHNGSTGIGFTDVFELSDGAMSGIGAIQFTIHINPSASLITMTPGTLPVFTFRGTSSCS